MKKVIYAGKGFYVLNVEQKDNSIVKDSITYTKNKSLAAQFSQQDALGLIGDLTIEEIGAWSLEDADATEQQSEGSSEDTITA